MGTPESPPSRSSPARIRPIPADVPIERTEEDTLGRAPAAELFASQILNQDVSKGFVVGVLGRWGSGKTSFVNLARAEFALRRIAVLDFNPWMFSGAEQLVTRFFSELALELKLTPGLAEVGRDLEAYGETLSGLGWVPLAGPWIERLRLALKTLGRLFSQRDRGIVAMRDKLTAELSGLNKPVVVVLDDVDRLTTNEIREVFKLVRLVASFPNVIYLLALDRGRVERALDDAGVPGRDYLEKILQLTIDLPSVADEALMRQLIDCLNEGFKGSPHATEVNEELWPDVFIEVIWPLIRTMRDVRRYVASARTAVDALVVVPKDVVHPGLLGGWGCLSHQLQRRTPDEPAR